MKNANQLRKISASIALCAFLLGSLLLAGCASTGAGQNSPDFYNYNNKTGYPAVGAGPWRL